jgi:hypothetical protein
MPAYQTTYYPNDKSTDRTTPIEVMDLSPSGDAYKHNYNKVFVQKTARGLMYNILVERDNLLDGVIKGLKLIQKEIRNNERN